MCIRDRVYAQGIDDKRRICIIRNVDEYVECNSNLYLPFAPGCIAVSYTHLDVYKRQV